MDHEIWGKQTREITGPTCLIRTGKFRLRINTGPAAVPVLSPRRLTRAQSLTGCNRWAGSLGSNRRIDSFGVADGGRWAVKSSAAVPPPWAKLQPRPREAQIYLQLWSYTQLVPYSIVFFLLRNLLSFSSMIEKKRKQGIWPVYF
jgi:hypothetical protein